MKPIDKYLRKPKSFWASVRSLSQHIGYSKGDTIIVPSVKQMTDAFKDLGLDSSKIFSGNQPTALAQELHDYFSARANALMKPKCPIPFNKQKEEKKAPAFLTGLVNMMIENHSHGMDCNSDPRELTTLTRDGEPLRTLARRVDGAFPTTVNPIAVWEIKEYYYTTTFGSRVADGVYETLLDGMEIEELREHENIDLKHYLMRS